MISKEQILEAAAIVFSQMGYSQSTIQDIATAAGIGKGTVYSYFESKPEILFEACKAHVELCIIEMGQLDIFTESNSQVILDKFVQYFMMQIIPNQSKSCFLFYELLVLAATDKNYQVRIAELLRNRQVFTEKVMLEFYEQGLKKGEFKKLEYPLEFIRSFTSSVDGLIFQFSFRSADIDLEKQMAYELLKFKSLLYKGEKK
jgi:AcrR family transcriptional regulator